MRCKKAVSLIRGGAVGVFLLSLAANGLAAESQVLREVRTPHSFDVLLNRVESAVQRNGLSVVATASASRGAAARGVRIRGNAMVMAFRNDYAVRLLAASVPAGIEAPLRIYVTENADGTASLSYRAPGVVFAPYGNDEVMRIASELTPIFEAIVRDAAGK